MLFRSMQAYRENVQARLKARTERMNLKEAAGEQHAAAKAEVDKQNEAIAQEHQERLADYRQEKTRIEDYNRELAKKNKNYKNLATGVWNYLKENAFPVYATGQVLHAFGVPTNKAAATIGGLWAMKRMVTNPTVLKVITSAEQAGVRPEVYIPVIASMIAKGANPPQPEQQEQSTQMIQEPQESK